MLDNPRALCDESCPRYNEHINTPRLRGSGSSKAQILFIGEAPGQNEDAQGRPFVGESGKLLRGMLSSVGIADENIYVTNSVKCATSGENIAPNQRSITCCRKYLIKEIRRIRPNVIAALGATALKAVLKRNGITKLKNNVFYSEEFETKVIPIYHPAYILRNPGALTDFQKGLGLLKDESGAAAVLRTSSILADHYDVDTREKVDKVLDQLEKVDAFVFDLETSSLQFTGAKILCVALSWRSGLGVTIKWDLFSGEQLYRFQQILCSKVLKVNHNLKFDLEMLMGQSLKVKGPYFDTLLAASLIDENVREKSLDALTLQHLDIGEYWAPLEEEKARICKERKIHKKAFSYDLFDYKLLADYAQWDADATFRLYELFSKELIKQDLADYYRKYSNPTMQLLVCMEFRGVLVDRKKLALLIETYRKTLLEHSKGISANKVVMEFERGRRVAAKQKIAVRWHKSDTLRSRYPDLKEYIKEYIKERDWQFNQKSVPQLSALLFEQLNLTPIKYSKRTKKPSTDEETLTTYAAQGVKLCQDIIDYRGLSKYIATYLVSTYDKSKKDKRIHANYLQAHTVTGRLCVDAATLIVTDRGQIPISKLSDFPQAKVLTHWDRYMPILNIWIKGFEEMFEVETSNGHTITCTQNHRFLTPTGWKKLNELPSYKEVLTVTQTSPIISVRSVGVREVWDIEVAEDHSYIAHGLINHNSCVSPNMQNIPRGAKDYKECLIADPGFTFVKADLKQAEFRCWAHCSNDLNMIRAIEQGMDIHKNTASSVFQVPEDEVTEEQRTAAKAVTFGLLMYGMGDRTAAKRYNLSVKQVASLRTHFFAQYPVAGQWLKEQVALAHEHGYVKTWLGRYRRLPEIFSDDDMLVAKAEREATNAPIQGLASNLNDHFMVKGYKLAVKNGVECCPAATQHDAQIFLVREGQEKKMVKIMKHVADHAFPDFRCKMVLDFEVGKTFGSLEKYHG